MHRDMIVRQMEEGKEAEARTIVIEADPGMGKTKLVCNILSSLQENKDWGAYNLLELTSHPDPLPVLICCSLSRSAIRGDERLFKSNATRY